MSLAKDPQSRFRRSGSIIVNGVETWGMATPFFFLDPANLDPADIETITITPDLAGRPWAIANKIYNSPVLDWVIVLFNKPLNPVNWPAIGSVIKAPAQRVVLPNV